MRHRPLFSTTRVATVSAATLAAVGCSLAGYAYMASVVGPPRLSAATVTGRGYHNETSIAINPTRPANVVTSYQIPATIAASQDSGVHWTRAFLPGVRQFQLSGDPSVFFDADGHAYALYIAFDRPEDYDTLGRLAHRNGIYLNRSDDGGVTWRPEATPVIAQPERPGVPFEDKPMATVDRSTDPGRRGNVYVAWTEFRRHESVILFSRSTDGGKRFAAPIQLSERPGSPKDSVGADEGTSLVVGPDGTVFVVWTDSGGIRMARSKDRGVSFERSRLIVRTPDIIFRDMQSVERANGYPSLGVDPRTGRLYMVWVDRRSGHSMPWFSASSDGGKTWAAPMAVAPAPSDSSPRFFAWLGVDPITRVLVIGAYRERPGGLVYDLAYSTDGGHHFTRVPWSTDAFSGGGEFLGDYTGVDVYDGVGYGSWAEAFPPVRAPGQKVEGEHTSQIAVGRAVFRKR